MPNDLVPFFNGKASLVTNQPENVKFTKSNKLYMVNVYQNKEEWKDIVKDTSSTQKLTLIKMFLDQLHGSMLEFYQTIEKDKIQSMFEFHKSFGFLEKFGTCLNFKNYDCYYNVNDRTFLSLINEILKEITCGKTVTFVIDSINESSETILFFQNKCDFFFKQGFFNLIVKNGMRLEPEIVRLVESADKNLIPVFVVFRESDCISAIESLPNVLCLKNYKNCLFLVQENQIKVVKELFDQLWPQLISSKKYSDDQMQLIKKFSYELVNYDLNTILDNNLEENVDLNKINLLAFRDKFDAVKLLNHCPDLPFVSIWNKNLSTCSFLSENIITTNLFWYNSVNQYLPSSPNFDYINSRSLNKELHIGDSVNLKREEFKKFKVLENFLTKKLIRKEHFEMIELIVTCLSSDSFLTQDENSFLLRYLDNFYEKLIHLRETKNGTFSFKHHPIGFVLLIIDNDEDLIELYYLIISCICSNNAVYLSIKQDLSDNILKFIQIFLQEDLYFKNMIVIDKNSFYLDPNLKPMIKYENKHIGTVIKYSEQKPNVDFSSLETKLFNSKTIFKPKDVHDDTN